MGKSSCWIVGLCVVAGVIGPDRAHAGAQPGNLFNVGAGTVEYLADEVILENAQEHLNFPFANRFSDGTMWMNHSIGRHTDTERGSLLWSTDNGQTWAEPGIASVSGMNSHEFDNGMIMAMTGWNEQADTTQQVTVHRWPDARTEKMNQQTMSVDLPWSGRLLLHRSLLQAADGSLVQSAYVRMSEEENFRSVSIRSTNGGHSWSFGGTMGYDASAPSSYGYTEPVTVDLADGRLLSLMRTGGPMGVDDQSGPLMQSISADHGQSWSQPVQVADFGVSPDVIRLENGALVASYGRPGVHMMVDFTGSGEQWEQLPTSIYDGPGSAYTTLMEVEPNVVMMLYDRSGFGSLELPADQPNRFHAATFHIVPEPGMAGPLAAMCAWMIGRRPRFRAQPSKRGN